MKTSLELIKEIVVWLEIFSKENPENELSLESFILWLNSKLFSADHIDESEHKSDTLNMELSFLLVLQNRYYRAYAKKVLGQSELSSPESFSFLYHLSLVDSYRKMELIKMHHVEPPSGIEVLKRLLQKEFIAEFDDPDDRRARRIRISETGKKEILSIMPKMQEVFHLMSAEMSLNEKLHVVAFLQQMSNFHMKTISST
jgi:DNA-binding MarR family transcriptional regulator